MSVVCLTSGMPFPPHSGGQLQQFEDLKRLSAKADIHLRVVATPLAADAVGCTAMEAMEQCCSSVKFFEAVPESAMAHSGLVPEGLRRTRCPSLSRDLASLLAAKPIDVIHIQGYYLLQHVPDDSRIPLLLFEENIEYMVDWSRHHLGMMTAGEPSWAVTRRYEHQAWRRAAMCGAVCDDDMRQMLADMPDLRVRLLPNGWDHLQTSDERQDRNVNGDQRVSFLGNYGWPPSEDAAVFLLEHLWPPIRRRVREAELVLIGTDPSPRMLELASHDDRVVVTGRVPSVAPLLYATDVFLCPLRVGGGVRIKMIEALSSGCAVVSTSVGAQGLPPLMHDALVVADTPDELVNRTVALLESAEARRELGLRAAEVAKHLPSWDDAAELVWQCWSELAQDRGKR
jgi:polysaccharide biosynthesis protein PslH